MPLFVISFEYLAKPVSPKFAIILQLLFVQDARFCRHIEILPNLRRILAEIRWFRKKCHFRKNPQLMTSFLCHLVLIFAKNASFVVSLKIFARPLINSNSPISQNLSFS